MKNVCSVLVKHETNCSSSARLHAVKGSSTRVAAYKIKHAPAWEDLEGWEPSAQAAHPSAAFETAWALQVMEDARERMRQECRQGWRQDIWEVFSGRILNPLLEQAEVLPYETLVARFGYRDPDQAGNILVTGKRMFLRCLRAAARDYTAEESEIEEEIRDLVTILSQGSTE